jgi:transcriptional antiterminator RfaH
MSFVLSDASCWYAIYTKPQQENRAESNLKNWNVETFAPKVKEYRYDHKGKVEYLVKPFFPNYIFARFKANTMHSKITFTRGVSRIVSFGANPTPIEDEIIELIKLQAAEDGFIRVGEPLKYGDKVVVNKGPFKSLTGMFERHATEADRVMILLTAVQYQSHIVVEREMVRKVG